MGDKMKVLIITNYCQTPNEKGNNRFNYIAKLLTDYGHDVEIITSTFSHKRKVQRKIEEEKIESVSYKFTMLYEPGYKKNVTLSRFYSHRIFGKNVGKYLEAMKEKPNVIYCAIPSLDVGGIVCKFVKKHNIPFIIDIQDLWPEAFQMVFKVPILKNIICFPFKRQANYIYSHADSIVAVSQTYVDRALKVNKKVNDGLSVFLGTDLEYFDSLKGENHAKTEMVKFVYIGTLGHSYDITTTIDAIKILQDKGIKNIEFIVMGDGPLKEKFENYAKDRNINATFMGRLPYEKMVKILCECDIAVNPIAKGAAQSIINKVGDYAAAGLPVINTQECEEYRNIVTNYKIGINCENNNSIDMANKIYELYNNANERKEMGRNNRKLAEEKFDRRKTYIKIVKLIEEMKYKEEI